MYSKSHHCCSSYWRRECSYRRTGWVVSYSSTSQEQYKAEEVLTRVKRKAKEHPEQPSAQLLRNELADVLADVLSHPPKWEAMRQSILCTLIRERRKNWKIFQTSTKEHCKEAILNVRQPTDGSQGSGPNFCESKKYWIAVQK